MNEENVSLMSNDSNSIGEGETLEDAIQTKLKEIGTQNLLLGAQSICKVILEKIYVAKNKPGKFSYRDYERLVDDIEDFCVTGLSRKVESDGTTTPITDDV